MAANALNAPIQRSRVAERNTVAHDPEREVRRELAFFAKMLHRRQYVSGCDGNLSVRLSKTRILTTPTGMCKGLLKPEHMVLIDSDGKKLEGALQPSSEIGMHLTIYQLREDVGAIVHAHPWMATGFACAGMDLTEPVCSELVLTLGRIPLAGYARPGSPQVGDSLRPLIPEHDAILMQNHGVVAYGETLSQAYLNMETVEHSARIVMVTKLLGRDAALNPDQTMELLALRKQHLPRRSSGHSMSASPSE